MQDTASPLEMTLQGMQIHQSFHSLLALCVEVTVAKAGGQSAGGKWMPCLPGSTLRVSDLQEKAGIGQSDEVLLG